MAKRNKSEVDNSNYIFKIGGAVIVVAVGVWMYSFFTKETRPIQLDLDRWWGPLHLRDQNDTSIRPFRIVFGEEMIKDLRYRLKNQRKVVPPLEGVAFEYGFNTNQLQSWLKYWGEEYPFKDREDFLNQYPQYKTNIQGLDIHFIRVRPKVSNKVIVPLLLLHGWPGSVREFYEAIPLLTSANKNRDFVVEVIVPSLPGFGFSDAAVGPGMGVQEMAVIFKNLMKRLGYKHYYVQGGDWGSTIGQIMATVFPEDVLGYHTNLALSLTKKGTFLTLIGSLYPSAIVDPSLASRMYPLKDYLLWTISEMGYFHLQATKPDTLGIAISDSPGGLLAYIIQIFSTGTRNRYIRRLDGGLDDHYPRSHLIDNLMYYWTPNSITTSFRIYAESVNKRSMSSPINDLPTPVPTWTMHARDEIIYQPPAVLRTKFPNLLNSTVLHDGGHFLALEMPEVFAEDVLKAIGAFRQWHRENKK